MDIDILLKFSKAFAIDTNEALTFYSSGMLKKLEARVVVKNDKVVVDNLRSVTEKIDTALAMVAGDDILYDHLSKEFGCASPYNYEVLQRSSSTRQC